MANGYCCCGVVCVHCRPQAACVAPVLFLLPAPPPHLPAPCILPPALPLAPAAPPAETLKKQFQVVKARVSRNFTYTQGSHVMRFGTFTIAEEVAAEFMGFQNTGKWVVCGWFGAGWLGAGWDCCLG